MKAQIHGLLVVLAWCLVGTHGQFNRTLSSSFDCNDIFSLTRTGGYINWNGASLSSCTIDIFSTSNVLDDICVQMQSINLQDCSVEVEFLTSINVVRRKWTCRSLPGTSYCTSNSFPKIRVTTPTSISGSSNYFSLRVYASRNSFTDIATTTVNTAYSLVGIIIGVIVGVIVLIIIIIVAICVCCCRQATGRRTQGHVVMQPANPQYPPQPGVYPAQPAQPGVYPPQT